MKKKLKRTNIDSRIYKKRLISIWNEIAPRYHKNWIKISKGPFKISSKIINILRIEKESKILDVGCGTGALVKNLISKINSKGVIIGIDSSNTAISIARKYVTQKNVIFIVADAEKIHFNDKFDLVTCQFALFFFPNAIHVLMNIKNFMKEGSILVITVHEENTPYFDIILNTIKKHVPDYFPEGFPNLNRFGTKNALKKLVKKSGFSDIQIREFCFNYSPGTVEDYWDNYLKYVAKPFKDKLNSLSTKQKEIVKKDIKNKVMPFTNKGKIIFPWKVLVLTAINN